MTGFNSKSNRLILSLLAAGFISAATAPVLAESASAVDDYKNRPLNVRVDRLERLMSSQKQLEFLYRLKQLQQENQQLRSLLEEQANQIRQLKQQQRDLYQDMNRRLGQEQAKSATPSTPESTETSAPEPAEIVDKSTVRSSHNVATEGVTEREVIIVDDKALSASVTSGNPDKLQTPPAVKPPVAVRKPMNAKQRQAEQKAYQIAYDELRARRYNAAREAFIKFIEQYPSGRYAHIAQYWIAESSYAQRNYEQAIKDYQHLLDVYPFSPKKAEAELKKAYSYYELGRKEDTRKTLQQLLAKYPDTTEAGQARRLLKKL